VDYLNDFVDEDNYLILQTLSGFRELPDLANGENDVDLAARDLQLHEPLVVGESPGHDLRPFLPEASLQQGANFKYCEFEHFRLHLHALIRTVVRLWLLRLLKWTLSKPLDNVHNFFDRNNDNTLNITAEGK
jgi:hypothetical protein